MTVEQLSFDYFNPQPLLIVISGPSGVGKDSVLVEMKRRDLNVYFVVTANTRKPRANEVEGVDYFFVSHETFQGMLERGELFEHARVYDDYKGVPKQQVREAFASGKDVVMRLDVQGAASIRKLCPEAVLIFLLPHDTEEWLQRLRARKTETVESLRLRIETARQEITRINEFDYVVINSDGRLTEAVDEIFAIIRAEHHRVQHRKAVI
jgi:guanylate kinase